MSICLAITDANWALTKDVFSVVGTLVSAVGVGVAFYIGKKGLATWERQLAGTDSHNFSKVFLVDLYNFKKTINAAREKFFWPDEVSEPLDLSTVESELRNYAWRSRAFEQRVKNIQKAQRVIHSKALEAEALWGKEIHSRLEGMEKLVGGMCSYISFHSYSRNPELPPEEMKEARSRLDKMNSPFKKFGSPEPDEFAKEVENVFSFVEAYLKSKMIG
ncbi:MAG: hypothetical protein RSG79_19870 [Pseudomonas sp.]